MKLRNLILAAAAVALPAAVQAQPVSGVYLGAGVGINQMLDYSIKGTNSKYTSDLGYVGLGSIGYGYGNGLRVELEGDYRFGKGKISPAVPGGSGNGQQYGAFLNALYDFNGVSPSVVPYLGAGVGYQWARLKGTRTSTTSDGYVAVQAIGGAAFPIASVPGLAVTAEARFTSALGDVSFKSGGVTTKVAAAQNISGLVGLRYAFGAPAAAPAPAPAPAPMATPAPAPARSFLVFFDWDKADLTARAKQIIGEAADTSKKVATTSIDVAGHADKSGTAPYNKALSLRRAQAVAAELVRLGVKEKDIVITAFGDTKPLVPTAAGVREPQNRRVEIVLK